MVRQPSSSRPLVDRALMPPRHGVPVEAAWDRNRAVMPAHQTTIPGSPTQDHVTRRNGRNGGAWVSGEDRQNARHVGASLRVLKPSRHTQMTTTVASVSVVEAEMDVAALAGDA
jgi:hypothetical protein